MLVPNMVKADINATSEVYFEAIKANAKPNTSFDAEAMNSDTAQGIKRKIPVKYPRMTELMQIKNTDGAIKIIDKNASEFLKKADKGLLSKKSSTVHIIPQIPKNLIATEYVSSILSLSPLASALDTKIEIAFGTPAPATI